MKYPKTHHIKGSKGVTEDDQVPLEDLPGDHLVIEEKLDGSMVSVSFENRQVVSRCQMPARGESASMFNAWVAEKFTALEEVLGSRYIMFGEWLYAKHTVFYDKLPSYFMEYDIYDRLERGWLSTDRRHALLLGTGIEHVPILAKAQKTDDLNLNDLIKPSLFRSEENFDELDRACEQSGYLTDIALCQTMMDKPFMGEGLFLKAETKDFTVGWYKFIREEFLASLLSSGSHWRDRQVIPNQIVRDSL